MTSFIDSQAIWSLRPDDIPGQVVRESRNNDTHVRIRVEVALKGPDGNLLGETDFTRIEPLPRVNKGRLVLFRIAKAGQQFYIDRLRIITSAQDRDDYNRAEQSFPSSHTAKIDTLISDLEARVDELAVEQADKKMAVEREAIDKTWTEHTANLEKYNEDREALRVASSAFATEQVRRDEEQQQIETSRQQLEQDKFKFEQVGGQKLLDLLKPSEGLDAHHISLLPALEDEVPSPRLIEELNKHFQSQNYSVDDPLITQALLCLCVAAATGQFIVLTGPPGSGKTSLVRKLAQAVGAGSGVVPVRPAWIDATDLIGFYNPDMKRYQPTPFLEYVIQAERYSDLNRLYLLVLDEMNLGRVENYAADLLSLLEKAREGADDAKLQIYPDEINNLFLAEQHSYLDMMDAEEANTMEQRAMLLKHMERYPSRLPFPKSLILLGTINVDETTHLPSPKFLDRSLTIQVSETKLPESLGASVRLERTSAQFSWALSQGTTQQCLEAGDRLTPAAQETWKLFMRWNTDYFKPLGARLSHRLPQVYRCYMGAASVLKLSNHQEVADTFVLSKIFPLISFRSGDKSETSSTETKREVVKRWSEDVEKLKNFPGVHAALTAMLARSGMIVRYLE